MQKSSCIDYEIVLKILTQLYAAAQIAVYRWVGWHVTPFYHPDKKFPLGYFIQDIDIYYTWLNSCNCCLQSWPLRLMPRKSYLLSRNSLSNNLTVTGLIKTALSWPVNRYSPAVETVRAKYFLWSQNKHYLCSHNNRQNSCFFLFTLGLWGICNGKPALFKLCNLLSKKMKK